MTASEQNCVKMFFKFQYTQIYNLDTLKYLPAKSYCIKAADHLTVRTLSKSLLERLPASMT